MKDRISTYPGRVTLTPVAGQENTYDMAWADQPVEAGTPLSKAALLTDAVAAGFGLTDAATPNDVFSLLTGAALSDGNGHVTDLSGNILGLRIQTGTYTGAGYCNISNPHNSLTFDFTPALVFIMGTDARYAPAMYFWGSDRMNGVYLNGSNSAGYSNLVTVSGSTMDWYFPADSATYKQYNYKNMVYRYVAIG